ncbi:MAG: Peptidase [Candidatus Saccharibacteria bacterium]|nr:Peptidase [Candidatus Saccharibacteria bacterium]
MKKEGEKKQGVLVRLWTKPYVVVGLFILTFWIGMMIGNGKLDLTPSRSEYAATTGLPENLDYSSVDQVYDALRDNYNGKLTSQQLLDGMKKGLADATGDPYTEYFTAKKAEEFQNDLNNSFSGIGAELGKDNDDNLIIVAPIADTPAEKAGLKPQDVVATINGETTANLSIDDAVKKIRGEKGTQVKLQVVRDKTTPLEFTITREDIHIKSVKWEVREDNIGVITISSFSADTSNLMAQASAEMLQKNVKSIILDLRSNPGGLLDAAVDVSEQWLPSGKKILEEKRGSVVVESYISKGPGALQGIPTVILTNQGSASASEIVTGALRDNNAARVIGEKTYGKGVVQQPICINQTAFKGGCEGDMLKVTVASWYRPNGQNINKKGITPDQTVKFTEEDAKAEKDPQQDAAINYLTTAR